LKNTPLKSKEFFREVFMSGPSQSVGSYPTNSVQFPAGCNIDVSRPSVMVMPDKEVPVNTMTGKLGYGFCFPSLSSISQFFTRRYSDFQLLWNALGSVKHNDSAEFSHRIHAVNGFKNQLEKANDLNHVLDNLDKLDPSTQELFFHAKPAYLQKFASETNPVEVEKLKNEVLWECDRVTSFQSTIASVNSFYQSVKAKIFGQSNQVNEETISIVINQTSIQPSFELPIEVKANDPLSVPVSEMGAFPGATVESKELSSVDTPAEFQTRNTRGSNPPAYLPDVVVDIEPAKNTMSIAEETRLTSDVSMNVESSISAPIEATHQGGAVDIPMTISYLQGAIPEEVSKRRFDSKLRRDELPKVQRARIAAYIYQEMVPESIKNVAEDISNLKDRFDALATPPRIPGAYIDPVTQEIMTIPLFDISHPQIQAIVKEANVGGAATVIDNFALRHHVELKSMEGLLANHRSSNPACCPLCKHGQDKEGELKEGKGILRENLMIDVGLQNES
jgi:hypothetical protein